MVGILYRHRHWSFCLSSQYFSWIRRLSSPHCSSHSKGCLSFFSFNFFFNFISSQILHYHHHHRSRFLWYSLAGLMNKCFSVLCERKMHAEYCELWTLPFFFVFYIWFSILFYTKVEFISSSSFWVDSMHGMWFLICSSQEKCIALLLILCGVAGCCMIYVYATKCQAETKYRVLTLRPGHLKYSLNEYEFCFVSKMKWINMRRMQALNFIRNQMKYTNII